MQNGRRMPARRKTTWIIGCSMNRRAFCTHGEVLYHAINLIRPNQSVSYCSFTVMVAVLRLEEVLKAPPHEKSSDEFCATI